MSKFETNVYNYIRVEGDTLKNINENTRKIWEEAITNGYKDIIDITEKDDTNKMYLVDSSVYHSLIQASREGEGIDPYGIANVNFSLIKRTDERWQKYQKQRLERGFDDSELWSLDNTITNFILPRLKRFREVHCGYPASMTSEKWEEILDNMIKAFEYLNDENLGVDDNRPFKECHDEREKIINKGLRLFVKYYSGLWW